MDDSAAPDGYSIGRSAGAVVLAGEIDIAAVEDLRRELTAPADGSTLTIDLRGVTFIDSSGIEALCAAHRDSDGAVVLREPSAPVERVLEITGLLDVFRIEHGRPDGR